MVIPQTAHFKKLCRVEVDLSSLILDQQSKKGADGNTKHYYIAKACSLTKGALVCYDVVTGIFTGVTSLQAGLFMHWYGAVSRAQETMVIVFAASLAKHLPSDNLLSVNGSFG